MIPIVLLVIAISVAIGSVSMQAGNEAVNVLTQRILLDNVNRINTATEKHLDGALIALESVAPSAANLPREPLFSTDMAALEARLWTASGLFMDVNNYVYFGAADGRFVGVYRIAKDKVQLFWREAGAAQRQVFQAKSIGDRHELIRTDQFDPRLRPWYQASKDTGTPTWSKIYNNFSFHYPTITLAKAVYKKDHEFAGVLATDVTLKELSVFLRRLDISKNSVAFVMDADGYIVATSGDELPEKTVNNQPARKMAIEMATALISETAMQIDRKNHTAALTRQLQTSLGTIEVAVSALGRTQGLDWVTVVAIPRADFMSSINHGFLKNLVIAIACIIFAVLISMFIIGRILKDIRKLTLAARQFGDGEPLTDLNIARDDEIGILAQTFVEMKNKLRVDKLTQVANRESLFTQIDYLKKLARLNPENACCFSLLFIDLDRFKIINDTHGHDAGDQVLVIIAARLRAAIHDTDEVARYGGDEFILLLKDDANAMNIALLADKVAAAIEQPIALNEIVVSVGVSIGWASFPEDGETYTKLIKVADSRMYLRKRDRKTCLQQVV